MNWSSQQKYPEVQGAGAVMSHNMQSPAPNEVLDMSDANTQQLATSSARLHTQPDAANPFQVLPPEVLHRILAGLPPHLKPRLRSTCKALWKSAATHPHSIKMWARDNHWSRDWLTQLPVSQHLSSTWRTVTSAQLDCSIDYRWARRNGVQEDPAREAVLTAALSQWTQLTQLKAPCVESVVATAALHCTGLQQLHLDYHFSAYHQSPRHRGRGVYRGIQDNHGSNDDIFDPAFSDEDVYPVPLPQSLHLLSKLTALKDLSVDWWLGHGEWCVCSKECSCFRDLSQLHTLKMKANMQGDFVQLLRPLTQLTYLALELLCFRPFATSMQADEKPYRYQFDFPALKHLSVKLLIAEGVFARPLLGCDATRLFATSSQLTHIDYNDMGMALGSHFFEFDFRNFPQLVGLNLSGLDARDVSAARLDSICSTALNLTYLRFYDMCFSQQSDMHPFTALKHLELRDLPYKGQEGSLAHLAPHLTRFTFTQNAKGEYNPPEGSLHVLSGHPTLQRLDLPIMFLLLRDGGPELLTSLATLTCIKAGLTHTNAPYCEDVRWDHALQQYNPCEAGETAQHDQHAWMPDDSPHYHIIPWRWHYVKKLVVDDFAHDSAFAKLSLVLQSLPALTHIEMPLVIRSRVPVFTCAGFVTSLIDGLNSLTELRSLRWFLYCHQFSSEDDQPPELSSDTTQHVRALLLGLTGCRALKEVVMVEPSWEGEGEEWAVLRVVNQHVAAVHEAVPQLGFTISWE